MWEESENPWNETRERGLSASGLRIGEDGSPVLFHEIQRFDRGWLPWIVASSTVIGVAVIAAVICFLVFSQKPVGKTTDYSSLLACFIGVLVFVGVAVLMRVCNLCIEIRKTGLFLRYFPFHLSFQKIPLEDVKTFRVVTYRALREYGGYGIKYGWKSKAFTVSGDRGVKLELHSGRSILLGSQKPEEMAEALAKITPR